VSRFLLTWELGGNTGHLHTLGAIGAALAARGHDLVFAVRDVASARSILGGLGAPVVQGPFWVYPVKEPLAANFSEVLFNVGYGNHARLTAIALAWRELIALAKPDMVIADHAPTALLAARALGVKRVTIGTGFTVPPLAAPMPTTQPWTSIAPERLKRADESCLAAINATAEALGAPKLERVADMFEGSLRVFGTFAELDHYGPRPGERYYGPISGARSNLPAPSERCEIFSYFRAEYPPFNTVYEALRRIGKPTLMVIPDAPPDLVAASRSEPVRVTRDQVDLRLLGSETKLVVTYGGHGTAARLLNAGLPLVLVPVQLEQALFAWQLRRARLAAAPPMGSRLEAEALIRRALEDAELAENARRFQAAHAAFDPDASLPGLVVEIEKLL
jgi:hypothetical protein